MHGKVIYRARFIPARHNRNLATGSVHADVFCGEPQNPGIAGFFQDLTVITLIANHCVTLPQRLEPKDRRLDALLRAGAKEKAAGILAAAAADSKCYGCKLVAENGFFTLLAMSTVAVSIATCVAIAICGLRDGSQGYEALGLLLLQDHLAIELRHFGVVGRIVLELGIPSADLLVASILRDAEMIKVVLLFLGDQVAI